MKAFKYIGIALAAMGVVETVQAVESITWIAFWKVAHISQASAKKAMHVEPTAHNYVHVAADAAKNSKSQTPTLWPKSRG